MKYTLRLVWYIAKVAGIAVSVFAILVVTFFVAMDSANVYVIVTDGMKARAGSVLTPGEDIDLSKYFAQSYLKNEAPDTTAYSDFIISDFNYKLTVESLWCKPWEDTAMVTVVESIPDFKYTSSNGDDAESDVIISPQWPKTRYQLTCRQVDGAWRIFEVKQLETLLPDPTRTPEPTYFITATPLPTPSPTPGLITTPTPAPEAEASPEAS